ncbi:hypothetical protein ACQP2U_43345 (plasmid) [Nocardia sp. CA-084685]|uniref:hypothetical protein n=1 Tax=Nocardia sp. CA-084685 TaxID=3239970 RepID=UPI003D98338C
MAGVGGGLLVMTLLRIIDIPNPYRGSFITAIALTTAFETLVCLTSYHIYRGRTRNNDQQPSTP